MRTKTHYFEQDGIRTAEYPTKAAAKQAWIALRDDFVRRAAGGPFIFNAHGMTLVVSATAGGWSYTVTNPTEATGRVFSCCLYNAPSQIAAIAPSIAALAQRAWTRDVPDDAAFFDALATQARLYPSEAKWERDNFLTVTAHWRAYSIGV